MTLLSNNPLVNHFEDLPAGLRLFQDSVARLLSEQNRGPWTPAVDIVETEDELVLKADVPDIDQNDIDIRVENGTLTLKGERKFEQKQEGKGYHRIERSYGMFSRSFALGNSFDTEKVKADYKNGVLTISVAKKEAAKPRSIKVEVNNA